MKEFYDTVRERKALVPSAAHRVCGSKSKKCSLPSDSLTDAQKRRLSGPVVTYNPTRPCTWAEFKSMPNDIAQEWLDNVQSRFRAPLPAIVAEVWGGAVTRQGADNLIRNRGLRYTPYRGRRSEEKTAALRAWAHGEETDQQAPDEAEVKISAPTEVLVVDETVTLEMVGELSAILAEMERRWAGDRVAVRVVMQKAGGRNG